MSALVLCSLTIIVTLLWSGIAKALDRTSTAQAIVNLQLDHFIPIRLATMTVPWGEIVLGLGLLLVPGMAGSVLAVLAIVLFAFYWGVIMRAIIAGNQATCNCFGSRSTAPVSFFTLFRNTGLLLAAFGAFGSTLMNQRSALGVLLNMNAEGWLWTFGAGIIAFVLWSIYRGETVVRDGETAVYRPAPAYVEPEYDNDGELAEGYTYADEEYEEDDEPHDDEDEGAYERLPIPKAFVTTVEGHRYSLRQLSKMKARVLFNLSPTCMPCREVIEELPAWQEKLPMLELNPVVKSELDAETLQLPDTFEIFIDSDLDVAQNFGVGTPTAVALGADGLLAGGPVAGAGTVKEFMEDIMYEMGVLDEEEA